MITIDNLEKNGFEVTDKFDLYAEKKINRWYTLSVKDNYVGSFGIYHDSHFICTLTGIEDLNQLFNLLSKIDES